MKLNRGIPVKFDIFARVQERMQRPCMGAQDV